MRTIVTFLLFCLLTVSVSAQADAGAKKTEDKVDPLVIMAKLEQLNVALKKNAKEMHQLRLKLLKTDPELKKLHESIMAMHRELALRMAANKEMQKLIMSFDKTRQDIQKLEKQLPRKGK
jgi:uncharacterized membrane protein YdfJ with MMPL/SSD domain